jgi:hypothetical protein
MDQHARVMIKKCIIFCYPCDIFRKMFRKFHLILDDVKHLLLFIISFSKTFLSNVGSSKCRDRMVVGFGHYTPNLKWPTFGYISLLRSFGELCDVPTNTGVRLSAIHVNIKPYSKLKYDWKWLYIPPLPNLISLYHQYAAFNHIDIYDIRLFNYIWRVVG